MALTSMWPASTGASSASRPVRMFTTPGGTSEVASTSDEVDRGQRTALARHDDGRVAGDDDRRQHAHEPEQARGRRGEHRHDTGRLGNREVEERPGDGVGASGDLGELVGPAGVPDEPVDGRRHDAAGAAEERAPRRQPPRRRTGRSGPRGPRPPGRSPGPGCRRSPTTTEPRRPGRRRRRRGRPFARRGRRWRETSRRRRPPRRSAPTPSGGRRR